MIDTEHEPRSQPPSPGLLPTPIRTFHRLEHWAHLLQELSHELLSPSHTYLFMNCRYPGTGLVKFNLYFSLRAWSYLNAMFIFKQQHCHWWLTMTFVICSETYHCIRLCYFVSLANFLALSLILVVIPFPLPSHFLLPHPYGLFPNYIRISWYLFFFLKDQLISLSKCLHSLSPTTCILNLSPSPLKGYLLV